MAAPSSKWACLSLLLAIFISLASAARIFPLGTDDHSSISTTLSSSDDLDWLPVTGAKRKLSVTPSQHDTYDDDDDDHSSVSTKMVNTATSYSSFEKGEGEDKDSSIRHASDKEIDELMDDLEDVGMDNTDGGFDEDKCDTEECGWGQGNAGSSYGWGWNQGGDSSYGWGSGGSGGGGIGGGGGGIGGLGGGGGGGIGGGGGGIGGLGGGGGSLGGSGGNSWHWGWHWGGGGSKDAASNNLNSNTAASGMTSDTDSAPAPMSN